MFHRNREPRLMKGCVGMTRWRVSGATGSVRLGERFQPILWSVMPASPSNTRDWSFVRQPFWLFSHVFAASVVGLFLFFAFGWQLPRHFERADQNELVAARSFGEPIDVDTALGQPIDDLEFTAVLTSGQWIEPSLIRVANRSQDGQAGEWQVGLFETTNGTQLLVNRGFIPRELESAAPPGDTNLTGWLRESRELERFGVADTGESIRAPRLDIEAFEQRFGQSYAPMWLQLEGPTDVDQFPDPVPLPELNSGPHFSYAVQWFIFASLGAIVYGLLLRKKAGEHAKELRRAASDLDRNIEPLEALGGANASSSSL